jgi:hypothetical protein
MLQLTALRSGIAALAILVALVAMAACGGRREAPLPAGATVLVVGDSITAGYGVTETQAWPARLAERTGWNVIAAGINGDRTAGGRERLPALLDAHAPVALVIELGGNDMLRGVADETIVANLDAMIARAAARGREGRADGAAAERLRADRVRGVLLRRSGKAPQSPLVAKALPSVLSESSLKRRAAPDGGRPPRARRATAAELAAIGLVRPG